MECFVDNESIGLIRTVYNEDIVKNDEIIQQVSLCAYE